MGNIKDGFGYDSMAFFGMVNASISHELKNVMAIISETAGLLDDLSEMASNGDPIAPDMLKSCTSSIMEEIQRGFVTIRQMNRFAHSVDAPVVSVDLMDVLDLVSNLSEYLAFTGKTHLRAPDGIKAEALTCPFMLQAIVYQALVYHFQHVGPGSEITLSIQPHNDSAWRIVFSGFRVKPFQVFPDTRMGQLASLIQVTMHWDRAADRLELHVPRSIEDETTQSV